MSAPIDKSTDAAGRTVFDAVVLGHVCLDLIPEIEVSDPRGLAAALAPGGQIRIGGLKCALGGVVPNVGLVLQRLGARVFLNGRVGNDLLGRNIATLLAEQMPAEDCSLALDDEVGTSYTIVLRQPGFDRCFLHFNGTNDRYRASDLPLAALGRARLCHFGYPPSMRSMYADGGRELAELFRVVKAQGVTTSLDMTMPDPEADDGRADWRAILGKTLPYVDIFLPSLDELLFMLRRDLFDQLSTRREGAAADPFSFDPNWLGEVAGECLELGARIVGIKLGGSGFYLRTGGQAAITDIGRALPDDPEPWADVERWTPCFQVEVRETLGAGDATVAGFLAAFLRGLSPADCVQVAVATGGCNVENGHDLAAIPGLEQLVGRIGAGWERHSMTAPGADWRLDRHFGQWFRLGTGNEEERR